MSDNEETRTNPGKQGAVKKPMSVRETSGYLVDDAADQRPARPSREFSVEDESWVARIAGEGSGGAGPIVAIRFCRAGEEDTPVRELLTHSIDLNSLHPAELRRLFDRAESINPPD